MTTIRVAKRTQFTQIERATLNDSRLSFKARGILAWLLDKPDDWETSAERIEKQGIEGREAVRSALRELENYGYLTRRQWRDNQNRFRTEWLISEQGNQGSPAYGKPSTASRHRKPVASNKTETNTETGFSQKEKSGARFPEPRQGCDDCAGGWRLDDGGNAVACGCEDVQSA